MADEEEKNKALRLIEFLTEVAKLKTRIVRDVRSYEQVLWISDIPAEKGCYARAWHREEEDSEIWLEVQPQDEPEEPLIPEICSRWVDEESLKKGSLPTLKREIHQKIEDPDLINPMEESVYEGAREIFWLSGSPQVESAWRNYIQTQWNPWKEKYDVWKSIEDAYRKLFMIHQAQTKLGEQYELVLGLGLAKWRKIEGESQPRTIRRHLIVASASLEFEPKIAKFTVKASHSGARIRPELDMLDVHEQPQGAVEKAQSMLEEMEDDPWISEINDVIKSLAHSIDPSASYSSEISGKDADISDRLSVSFTPAIILRRKKDTGFMNTMSAIKKKIEGNVPIPENFSDIAEINLPNEPSGERENAEDTSSHIPEEIFFPLPSNEEQFRIVERMRRENRLLVQGPPGTGKSHTIANLICHLLAEGNRILITAKTPRALKVLKGLVPEELRPLSINLLGVGIEERASLEESVNEMLRKQEGWNPDRVEEDRKELEREMNDLRREGAEISLRLRTIREKETHAHSIGGGNYRGTAAQIGDAMSQKKGLYSWLQDKADHNLNCPTTEEELKEVLSKFRFFSEEKMKELASSWPVINVSAENFTKLIETIEQKNKNLERLSKEADRDTTNQLSELDEDNIEKILHAFRALQSTLVELENMRDAWVKDVLQDAISGSTQLWNEMYRITGRCIILIGDRAAEADENHLELMKGVSENILLSNVKTLIHLQKSGKKIRWGPFRFKQAREHISVLKKAKLNGVSCAKNINDLGKLETLLQVKASFKEAWGSWERYQQKHEGSHTLQLQSLKDLHRNLEKSLSVEQKIRDCQNALRARRPMEDPNWKKREEIDEFAASCAFVLAGKAKKRAQDSLEQIKRAASAAGRKRNVHSVTQQIVKSVDDRDYALYSIAVQKINALEDDMVTLRDFHEVTNRLRKVLPVLMQEMKNSSEDPQWNERIPKIRDAWHWAQAKYWLEKYTAEDDLPALMRREKQIEKKIRDNIAELAALRAWTYFYERLEDSHRRHMIAWQQAMRRLGRGTSRYVHRYRRDAQRSLDECLHAVPSWVMPLNRVWDTVSPSPGMFDVIIVDEASQCGYEAIPLFYLGKKVLVVGDDKQISPEAVGITREDVHRLMDDLIKDFEFKSSFSVESSLFDQSRLRFGTNRITLREHFRCMPEIIAFSNNLCYSDTPLIPLRQYGPDRLMPPIENFFISGGYREGNGNKVINPPEAVAVVKHITDLCSRKEYKDKTMGVVVLQGEEQANLIEGLLMLKLSADEIENRQLICGNPYVFQGDERDVIFLSMVAASGDRRIGALTRDADKRRFNVAASRAKDRLILFHSVKQSDLNPSCMRTELLNFFTEDKAHTSIGLDIAELERIARQANRSIDEPPAPFESWFEVDVALEIFRKGFRNVIPQYQVAGKRIDLVIQGGSSQLAVECDGDAWHGPDQYEADMARQRQLERCGWEFFRIRGSVFYSDRQKSLEKLWELLEERGIHPTG